MLFEKISIVGVGLLGGSLGLAIRAKRIAGRVEGFVRREESIAECESLAIADRISNDLASVLADSDLTILCTPVERMKSLVEPHASVMKRGSILTDVGSVKQCVVDSLETLHDSAGVRFIGSHPMAGGERVGVAQSRADLFESGVCAVTPTAKSDIDALNKVNGFWRALGMKVIQLGPQLHDQLVCRASHLPHLLSSVLAGYVLDPEFPEEQRQLCAGGFRDTTRVASGPVGMWQGILRANKANLISDLAMISAKLDGLKNALANDDFHALEVLLRSGFERRERWLRESEDVE